MVVIKVTMATLHAIATLYNDHEGIVVAPNVAPIN